MSEGFHGAYSTPPVRPSVALRGANSADRRDERISNVRSVVLRNCEVMSTRRRGWHCFCKVRWCEPKEVVCLNAQGGLHEMHQGPRDALFTVRMFAIAATRGWHVFSCCLSTQERVQHILKCARRSNNHQELEEAGRLQAAYTAATARLERGRARHTELARELAEKKALRKAAEAEWPTLPTLLADVQSFLEDVGHSPPGAHPLPARALRAAGR